MTPEEALETLRRSVDLAEGGLGADDHAAFRDAVSVLAHEPERREGREGMVTAYDHRGEYAGCIGAQTWRWLLEHPEMDTPSLAAAVAERDKWEATARAESDGLMMHYDARIKAEADARQLRAEIDEYRIEADHGHDDYEDAEHVIIQIAEARPNMPFDPWARTLCQEFLDRPRRSRATIAAIRADARQLREALERIKANAISWHGIEPDGSGHVRALKVIAQWCDDAFDPTARAALRGHDTGSEGRGNREHLSSAKAAAPPGPERGHDPASAGEPTEEARHRGESRNPQGVLDGNAPPSPAVSAERGQRQPEEPGT